MLIILIFRKSRLIVEVEIPIRPKTIQPRMLTPGFLHSEQQAINKDPDAGFVVSESRTCQRIYHTTKAAIKVQKVLASTEAASVANQHRAQRTSWFSSNGPTNGFAEACVAGLIPNVPDPTEPQPGTRAPLLDKEGGQDVMLTENEFPLSDDPQTETPIRKPTPIESDVTPSDWLVNEAAAKKTRAHKQRREISDTEEDDDEDDEELAAEAVVSPDGKRPLSKKDKGKGRMDPGMPGRKDKDFEEACEVYGKNVREGAEEIATRYGARMSTVLDKALLLPTKIKLCNPWNKFQQMYKANLPKTQKETSMYCLVFLFTLY